MGLKVWLGIASCRDLIKRSLPKETRRIPLKGCASARAGKLERHGSKWREYSKTLRAVRRKHALRTNLFLSWEQARYLHLRGYISDMS